MLRGVGQLRVKRVGQFTLKQAGHFLVKWVGQFALKLSESLQKYHNSNNPNASLYGTEMS
ncbi:MAG: phage hypothetical protein [Bacteroidetes bacterium HLUCCA01]|nr:MAG: phage hypothetical protein [Bacteroidetes bacterium HLUCCA01]